MLLTSIISIPPHPLTTRARILPSTTTSTRCPSVVGTAASALRGRFKSEREWSFKQVDPNKHPNSAPTPSGRCFLAQQIAEQLLLGCGRRAAGGQCFTGPLELLELGDFLLGEPLVSQAVVNA